MKHLHNGLLRRALDEPHALLGSQQRHLDGCLACRRRSAAFADAAGVAAGAFGMPRQAQPHAAGRSETAAAPRAKSAAVDHDAFRTPFAVWSAGAAAILLALFVATPLRSVAAGFLAIFEPRAFVALPISPNDAQQFRALPNLTDYGTMRQLLAPHRMSAADARAAARLANMPVRTPAFVPAGTGTPLYRVISRNISTFTFSAAQARKAAAGRPLPPLPPGLDGSRLEASIGPAVLASYGTPAERAARIGRERQHEDGWSHLLVAQMPAPVVISNGVSAAQLVAYLSAQPGVSPQLRAELRAIGDPTATLPIPIPIDRMRAAPVIVDGTRGLAIGDNTGVGAGVIWQEHGIIYGVAGALPLGTVLAVANSLHV